MISIRSFAVRTFTGRGREFVGVDATTGWSILGPEVAFTKYHRTVDLPTEVQEQAGHRGVARDDRRR